MRLVPASLVWRTLIVIVAALGLSQAASLWLLHEHVTLPRMALAIGQFVSHLKTISAALQTMTAPQQQEFIARIAEKEGIRILPVRGTERMRPAADVKSMQLFRDRIRELFGPQTDVYVLESPVLTTGNPPMNEVGGPHAHYLPRLPMGGDADAWAAHGAQVLGGLLARPAAERDASALAGIEWARRFEAGRVIERYLHVYAAALAADLQRAGTARPFA